MGSSTVPLLFVIDYFRNPNAGTESQLFQLVKGLDRSRFKPFLLVFKSSDFLEKGGFPCEYAVLGHSSISSPITWYALFKFARRYRASGGRLAHIFFNDSSVVCPPIFRLFGIQTIISRRDMGYWYTRRYLAFLSLSGRFVSAVITNSEAVKVVTNKHEPVALSDIYVIYNGYEIDHTPREIPTDLRQLKDRYKDCVFVGIVANIRPIKRIEDAVEAVAMLVQQGAEIQLVVIGDGDQTALRALSFRLGVEAQVHFLGARLDVKESLGALDIGLLCSESEGFSNSVIEYMQAGLPVICSGVGGNLEAINDGETGLLYSPGDLKELAGCLNKLVIDRELRVRLGQNARTIAKHRFSMEAMVQQHIDVYDSLLHKE